MVGVEVDGDQGEGIWDRWVGDSPVVGLGKGVGGRVWIVCGCVLSQALGQNNELEASGIG